MASWLSIPFLLRMFRCHIASGWKAVDAAALVGGVLLATQDL